MRTLVQHSLAAAAGGFREPQICLTDGGDKINARVGRSKSSSSVERQIGKMLKLALFVAGLLSAIALVQSPCWCQDQASESSAFTPSASPLSLASQSQNGSRRFEKEESSKAFKLEAPEISNVTSQVLPGTSLASLADRKEEGDEEEKGRLSTRLPRQHFRLKSIPTSNSASPFKLVSIRRRASQSTKPPSKVSKPEIEHQVNSNGSTITITTTIQNAIGQGHKKMPQKGAGKRLSSAALKKLLAHTLPRLNGQNLAGSASEGSPLFAEPDNGSGGYPTSNPNKAGSNFKFVFIQRATRPPSVSISMPGRKSAIINQTDSANLRLHQQSMASSVSKKLAHSLFYSASNLINNQNQFATASSSTQPSQSTLLPSISAALAEFASLANQSRSEPQLRPSSLESNKNKTSNQDDTNKVLPEGDIKRLSSSAAGPKEKPVKKSRPSKIYNLPVKFVSNGQPSGAMFQSIKHHFAAIKKLQQQAVAGGGGQGTGNGANKSQPAPNRQLEVASTLKAQAGKGRKKLANKLVEQQTRLKGTNSRLIYLPLKYLSNAKPTMLSSVISGGGGGGGGESDGSGNRTKASRKSSSAAQASGTKGAHS